MRLSPMAKTLPGGTTRSPPWMWLGQIVLAQVAVTSSLGPGGMAGKSSR